MSYLLILLALVSCMATAGYKGKDPVEMSKTVDNIGNVFRLYSLGLNDGFTMTEPVCHERNQMWVSTYDGKTSIGCWWKIGKQVFGYSYETGVTEFTMDLLMVNDNFTGIMPKGF